MEYSIYHLMGAETHPLNNYFMSIWVFSVNIQVGTYKDFYHLDYIFCQQPCVVYHHVVCSHCPKTVEGSYGHILDCLEKDSTFQELASL